MLARHAADLAWHFSKISPTAICGLVHLTCGLFFSTALFAGVRARSNLFLHSRGKFCPPMLNHLRWQPLLMKVASNVCETQMSIGYAPNPVRFGSKADICGAKRNVRFTPNIDRESEIPQKAMSALPPKADMCGATRDVRFGPKADICTASVHVRFTPKSEHRALSFKRQLGPQAGVLLTSA